MEEMTKEEMQLLRDMMKEEIGAALEPVVERLGRGSTELEAYRNLMEILGIEFPNDNKKAD